MDYEEGELNEYGRNDRGNDRPTKPRKSKFSGTSIFERAQRKKEAEERRNRARSRSRSRSRSHSHHHHRQSNRESKPSQPPVTQPSIQPSVQPANPEGEVVKPDDDPNSVHKQCERAAGEALRRALVLLKQRGLLEGDYAVEEMAPIETTVVNPDEVKSQAQNETKKEEPVEPKVEVTPAVSSAMSKLLASKLEKDSKPGVLSWYKPATGASALKSVLEKQ